MTRKIIWLGDKLARLEADYNNKTLNVRQVAERNKTDIGTIGRLAERHQWPPRHPHRALRTKGQCALRKLSQRFEFLRKKVIKYETEMAELSAQAKREHQATLV